MASVESVSRAFRIVEALAESPAGLSDTARRVGLPKSTVARLLGTLEEVGAVERDEGGYQLGPLLLRLSGGSGGPAQLAAFGLPYLDGLTDRTGEAAGLSVRDGRQVRYIAQTEAANPVQVRDWTGALIPLHLTSSGVVLLAELDRAELEEYLAGPLAAPTPRSVSAPAAILQRLQQTREQGHAWAKEEYVEGGSSVAAPVRNQDGVVAAIHVHGPAYRFPKDDDHAAELANEVMEASRRMSAALSGEGWG